MAKKIGEVEYVVSLDGKTLPAEARALGREIGESVGAGAEKPLNDSFEKSFSKIGSELAADMKKNGELGGDNFSESMSRVIRSHQAQLSSDVANIFGKADGIDNFAKNFDSVDEAVGKLRGDLKELNSTGDLSDQMWGRLGGTLNQWAGKAKAAESQAKSLAEEAERVRVESEKMAKATDDAAASLDRIAKSNVDKEIERKRLSFAGLREELYNMEQNTTRVEAAFKSLTPELEKNNSALKDSSVGFGELSTNAKQILLIIGAIVGGTPEIVSLSSLIGSLALVLGTSLAALAGGAVIIGVAFQGMFGDLKDVTSAAQPAAKALQDLATPLGALKDAIQGAVFQNLAGPIKEFGGLITALQPVITAFATSVGSTLGKAISTISSGPAQEGFKKLIEGLGPIFDSLVTAVLSFSGGLGNLLIDSLPFATTFAAKIAEIGDDFLKWTESDAGRQAIATFLEHGATLAGPLLTLVGQLATTLSSLVTPTTIAQTAAFLGTMTSLLPALGGILDAVGKLDIFGVIATVLETFLVPLMPIIDILGDLMLVIGTLIKVALEPLMLGLQLLFLPFQILAPIMDIIAQLFVKLVEKAQPLWDAAQALFQAFGDVAKKIGEALAPKLQDLFDKIVAHLPDVQQLADVIMDEWIPAIEDAAPTIADIAGKIADLVIHILDAISGLSRFAKGVGNFVDDAMGPLGRIISTGNAAIGVLANLFGLQGKVAAGPLGGGGGGGGHGKTAFANGGILTAPDYRLAGENGPEAYIPLTGPLTSVNPEVRDIAAYARGLTPSVSSTTSNGRSVIVEAGAIVIQAAQNASNTANSVLDNLVASL